MAMAKERVYRMLNFGPTFIWTIVNLIVLYIVLKKLFFKPVTQFMENRTNSIRSDLEKAEEARAYVAEFKQKQEEELKAARQEADKILSNARSRAQVEYDAIISAAREEAEAIMMKAREELELERQQMISSVKNEVATLALAAASKVIQANMDTETNRALVNKFIDEAGAA